MKKLINPGFEFAFALGLIAIFALPPIVMAQKQVPYNVTISNNDTTINGKNIKELTANERKDALKKLDNLNHDFNIKIEAGKDADRHLTLRMRKNGDNMQNLMIERDGEPGEVMATIPDFNFKTDSAGKLELRKLFKGGDAMPGLDMDFNFVPKTFGGHEPQVFSFNNRPALMRTNRKNSQSFNYSYTDNDGISTHLNFNAGEAGAENAKRIAGAEKLDLEIKDLNIVPLFSSGKTTISFSLPTAGVAEVTLKNTEGNVIWTDRTVIGSFSKSFDLLKNGVYYLQVKQGTKTGLKRITKEE
jgi:hypothetical protein